MCKESGRSWPQLDDDEVVDYLIMEAVATKIAKSDNDREKQRKVNEWKADKSDLWEAVDNAHSN